MLIIIFLLLKIIYQFRILYQVRLSFKNEGKIKTLSGQRKQREFVTSKPILVILKEDVQAEGKLYWMETQITQKNKEHQKR